MKIVSLTAENVKRLVVVEIKPDGNVVEITGRNGQGKTSVLDSIWWALAGATHIQAAPIRKGANEARIRLDLGEIKVIRTFRRKAEGEGFTTSIAVEGAEGARFPSPQKMLDSFLGELAFDPLAFSRMEPKEQFDALRRFVPDVDFVAIENANRGDYERRTELNRFAKQERAAAMVIVTPTDTPEELVDKSALVAELDKAGKDNEQLAQRRANRDRMARDSKDLRDIAVTQRNEITRLRAEIASLEERAASNEEKANEIDQKLADAPPLPAAIDTAPIVKAIAEADARNDNVRKLSERMKHHKRAQELEAQVEELTQRMKDRDEGKRAAIAAAKMPVPGLEFGDGEILLNGVPFAQGSDAEQLRTSVAIAMAMNPKLRVIRIRDGSLLDEDAMKLLAEMAKAQDMQVWIERVDASGKIGFVLEDGHVRKAGAEVEGAAA